MNNIGCVPYSIFLLLRMLEDKLVRGLVLFVDDNENMLEMLRQRAERKGFFSATAHNSEEALAKYRQIKPDAVVLDMKMEGNPMAGLGILEDIVKIDDLPQRIIITGNPTYETAKSASGNILAYFEKPIDDQFWQKLREAVSNTEKKRRDLRSRVAHLILNQGAENPNIAPLLVDEYYGRAFQAIHDNFPYRNSVFSLDSVQGAASLQEISVEKPYPESVKAFLFKKYGSKLEFYTQIDNQSRSDRANIKHPKFIYYFGDGNNFYAMHPVIFGPNYAHMFSIINGILHSDKSELKKEAAHIKDALIKTSLDSSVDWYSTGSNDWRHVHLLLKRKGINTLFERSLQDMLRVYTGALKNKLSSLMCVGAKKFGQKEVNKFTECMGRFSALAPYDELSDNLAFTSVLLDYSPQNVGVKMGVLRPTPEDFFKIMKEIEHERGGLSESLARRYTIFDTLSRFGNVFEDFINFIHSPELGLSITEKLDYREHFLNRYSAQIGPESPGANAWMEYAVMGIYKGPAKSMRYKENYMQNNLDDLARRIISQQEFEEINEAYVGKIKGWLNEAKWFAALGHLLAVQKRGLTSDSIEAIIRDNLSMKEDVNKYQAGLIKRGIPGDTTKLADRMIYMHNFLQHYFADIAI